ncbi:MAG: Fur family transcriptional regulator, stress-responsive regulator [Solirubrobacterales bacterium]|jgi:Fe2+ or Zn2+ uptake regulation protein|nr:Fur family transcriptional regulator, stress-responsive regulator [Solirubrobacterales bacterium]
MAKTPTHTRAADGGRVADALHTAGYRVTSQRVVIHTALAELAHHATAEEVRAAVETRLPNVSLPTVYAGLEALEDAGLVRRVATGQGPTLYDAGAEAHHHVVCRRCGAVEDLLVPVKLGPALEGAAAQGFTAEAAEVVVRGLCARCRAT